MIKSEILYNLMDRKIMLKDEMHINLKLFMELITASFVTWNNPPLLHSYSITECPVAAHEGRETVRTRRGGYIALLVPPGSL